MTLVICPRCKGAGRIEIFIYQNHTEGSVYEQRVCPLCLGHRVVKETIKVTHTPLYRNERKAH